MEIMKDWFETRTLKLIILLLVVLAGLMKILTISSSNFLILSMFVFIVYVTGWYQGRNAIDEIEDSKDVKEKD
jgi:hypothetical protein